MVYTITHASDMINVAKQIMESNEPTYVIRSATGKYYSINFDDFNNKNQIFWVTEKGSYEIPNPYYVSKEEVAQPIEEVITPAYIEKVIDSSYVDTTPNLEVENIRLTNELKYAKEDLQRVTNEKEEYLSRLTNELNAKKLLEKKCTELTDKIVSLESNVTSLINENDGLKVIVQENSVLFNKTLGELIKDIKEFVAKETM